VALAGEQQKGRLEDIFRIMFIALDAAADLQHHWPVPLEQGHERRLLPPLQEELQELAVARFFVRFCLGDHAELLQHAG
jgi:hypothetical protein